MTTSEFLDPRYFTSPHPVDIADATVQLVFLAGPVQGAPNYHDRFAQEILEARPDVAASPRRTEEDQLRFDSDGQVKWDGRIT